MKLEELLGEELYAQVQARLDEVNGNYVGKEDFIFILMVLKYWIRYSFCLLVH